MLKNVKNIIKKLSKLTFIVKINLNQLIIRGLKPIMKNYFFKPMRHINQTLLQK